MAVYFITGASGYIGSMLAAHLWGQDKNNRIIAAARNRKKAESILPKGTDILQADLSDRTETERLEIGCDYVIHCASVTQSAQMLSHPVEVVESIVNTTQNVLELAKRCRIKSMVNLSSMEVYGDIDCSDGHRVSEEELGEIDLYKVRSCYPLGKRMAENICCSYFREYGVPVKTARLAQTFGEGVLPSDNRVFVQFAKAIRQGTDIVLHTAGNSMGNYCSIHDAVRGILTILRKGSSGQAYNVVNEENTMTILQMAELVARDVAGGRIGISFDIPEEDIYGYAASTGLRLSGRKLRALGWEPKEGLVQMYQDLLRGM